MCLCRTRYAFTTGVGELEVDRGTKFHGIPPLAYQITLTVGSLVPRSLVDPATNKLAVKPASVRVSLLPTTSYELVRTMAAPKRGVFKASEIWNESQQNVGTFRCSVPSLPFLLGHGVDRRCVCAAL